MRQLGEPKPTNKKPIKMNKNHSEKLDFLLKVISENKQFISSKDLYKKLDNKIEETELTLIINKLFLDNYIEKKIIEADNNSKLTPPYFCRITYHGLLFLERGGFLNESNTLKRKNNWTKAKMIANTLNAISILAIALIGIYVSWDSKKKDETIVKNNSIIDSLKIENKELKIYKSNLKK